MRLTTILLITMMMQVSANGLAQSMSFSKSNTTYKEVFDQIRKQLGYNVVWPSKKFDANKNVDVNIRNASLERVLEQVLDKQEVSYVVKKKTVVLTVKVKSFVDKVVDYFSAIDVKGKVVDEQGLPLPGASVKAKAGTLATITDKEGDFFLKGVPEDAIIVIAYLGYKPLEFKASVSLGVIKLELNTEDLQEVVINKGYYETTRELNTGSVSRVDSKVIEKQPVTNPLAAIAGRMAGVQIQQTSGVPGSDFKIEIRGRNSLRENGNQPLFIVDGIPFSMDRVSSGYLSTGTFGGVSTIEGGGASPLTSLNLSDVQSIEVLKDADATAIYGSRGANGVVLITTRRGKAGKTKFDLNVYSGLSIAPRVILLNTNEYIKMRKQAFNNDGLVPSADPFSEAYAPDLTLWDTTRYTNWQKELIRPALSTSVQSSISGGASNTQFLLSSGYRKESSTVPGDFAYQKISFHIAIDHQSISKKLFINSSLNATQDNNYQSKIDITGRSLILPPNAPALYKSNEQLNWENSTWKNPLAGLEEQYKGNTNNFIGNTVVGYNIIKGLQIKSSFGANYLISDETAKLPSTIYDPAEGRTSAVSVVSTSSGHVQSWIIEPQLTWETMIASGKLNILTGATIQRQDFDRKSDRYRGFPSNSLLDNISLAEVSDNNEMIKSIYRYASLFGRVSYNFDGKYIANITGRRDGSSRFGPGRQFADFGSVGLAWVFSNESFTKDGFSFLSYGKLRSSYGITGNDQIGDYQYLDTYSSLGNASSGSAYLNQYDGNTTLASSRLYNPDYAWEATEKLEVAVELGFLNDRIMFNVNYYQNRSSNQLINYTLPSMTGFNGILSNLPATIENTGWELELNTNNVSKSLSWKTSLNITVPSNKLVSFPNIEGSPYNNSYTVGKSIYNRKKFEYLGVDPYSGYYTFRDVNGDGVISSPEDARKDVFIGQYYFGGINNSLKYKSVTLDLFFQFVKQTGNSNMQRLGIRENVFSNYLNKSIWTKPGDHADLQRLASDQNGTAFRSALNYFSSDFTVTDASFVRLKNVFFSYELPKRWMKSVSGHLYLQAQNILTFSSYEGVDPETQFDGALPPLRVFTLGLRFIL